MFEYFVERIYIVNYLMNDVMQLGVKVDDVYVDGKYRFKFGNKILEIQDCFFAQWTQENYLSKHNIPKNISWFDCPYGNDRKIPMIYGKNELVIQEDYVCCGLDVFASSFFMLTRWEELFLPKDKFGRCDENEMFVVKHHIYNRPIVNEYIELLRSLLESIGVEVKGLAQKFHPFITHDVDDLFRYASLKNFCKNLAGDVLHRKSLNEFFRTCKNYVRFQLGKMKDPFDTFDELMDYSRRYGLKNAFYFMPSHSSEFDARYDIRDKRVKKIIANIVSQGHEIGIHPSKNTFNNSKQFGCEVERLKKVYSQIQGGRQHFLLYDLPHTLCIWERAGLKYDSGLGFASRGGFRCGICYPYPFFDVLKRRQMDLFVRPLGVMDVAVFESSKDVDVVKKGVFALVDTVKRYKGEFVFLWHNDNFYRTSNSLYMEIYRDIVAYMFEK